MAQRTNEFGIRMALGAERKDVLRLVFQSGVRDPLILAGMALVLRFVSALACFLPVRRASSVDPIQALRYE